MKRSLGMLAAFALAWCLITTTAKAEMGAESALPTHSQLSRLGLERGWWAQAVLNPHRDKLRSVAIDEEVIILQATSGTTTAFDAETGRQLWALQFGRLDQQTYPAIMTENLAMLMVGATMYAVDKKSGRAMWTLILPGQPSTGPSFDEKHVYFGTLDGSLYAYSLRKIRNLYEQRRLPQWSNEAQVWKYKAAKEITSPPITTGRVVNFASRDGSLYSVTAIDRKLVYQLETDKAIVAPLARHDNTMFMASEDNSFYALNLLTGKVEWEFTSGLPIRKAPVAMDSDLYVLPDRGGMYSLDPSNGDRKWWQPNLTNFVAMLGKTVAATDLDGNLVIVTREKGEVAGSLPLRRYVVRPGNERTDRIYLATESGLVICLRPLGHNFPKYHRYPDRLPLLPEMESDEAEASSSGSEPAETP